MSTFEDRAMAFEAKFAHDAEMLFRAESRRNRLVGMWAAGLMNKNAAEAVDYVRALIKTDLEEAGDADVQRKLVADLAGKASAEEIAAKVAECFSEAKAQLAEEA